jgi:dihydrofolate reductase
MRKIIVLTFISLDGVMQAPGGSGEDDSGNFKYGGWTVPYFDDSLGKLMAEQMNRPFDLLLGRKTFEVFAAYWPYHQEEGAGINKAIKYVASNTLTKVGLFKRRCCNRNKYAQTTGWPRIAGARQQQSNSDVIGT